MSDIIFTSVPLPEWVQYIDVQLMEPGRWGACLYDVPEDKATALDCRIDGYGETYLEALEDAVLSAVAFEWRTS